VHGQVRGTNVILGDQSAKVVILDGQVRGAWSQTAVLCKALGSDSFLVLFETAKQQENCCACSKRVAKQHV
jgi:hypothetical protein